MKIAHIGLMSYYTENMSYQENILSEQNVLDGHEVLVISNAAKYENGLIVETGYEKITTKKGIQLVRLPYNLILCKFLTNKVRKVKGLYHLLADFEPEIIFTHDLSYWSVLDVVRYKKTHPAVKLYADTHTDYFNSGTNWLSLHILHGIFYKRLIQKVIPYLDKYFILGADCKKFSVGVYGIPEHLMEFYPLGGIIPKEEAYLHQRTVRRAELGVDVGDILLVHSGKMDAYKRTEDLLHAFHAVQNPHLKLAIIGSIPEEMKPILLPLIESDKRVQYLGWKTAPELIEYLCACDLYCQPGSASATMQNAVCCGCGILLQDIPQYAEYFDHGNVLWIKSRVDIENAIRTISENGALLQTLRENSLKFAKDVFDYRKLAARLYQ